MTQSLPQPPQLLSPPFLSRRRCCQSLASALIAAPLGAWAQSEPGITETEIRIGMSNALTGPAAGLGTQIKAGAQAYFDKINQNGGVHGRKIVLLSQDDGYEPAKAVAATKKLIEQDQVFLLFGYVGTPISTSVVPLISRAKIPYLFPFTGAQFLRNPINKWVFNLRPSYFDETYLMIERLTQDVNAQRIALFIQDDSFGEAGKAGALRALHKRRMKPVLETRYKRNTTDVAEGIAQIKKTAPDAVIFIGTYKSFAAAIKQAKAEGIRAPFLTVSFVGTAQFIEEAGADGEGVYITQVMPSPRDDSLALVREYRADMKNTSINHTSLEGYANAAVLVHALQKAGPQPNRQKIVDTLESLSFDLGGMHVAFSPMQHQGLKNVFLTRIENGQAKAIEKM